MKYFSKLIFISVFFCLYFSVIVSAQNNTHTSFAPNVNLKTGTISVPKDYNFWPVLGTWSHAIGKEKPGTKEFHIVYTQPETIAYYKKHRKFPDGAVLVKELINTKTMSMTTGPFVSHATTIKGWFVLVRDTQNRFPNSKLWGEGWGWSFFKGENSVETVSKNYKEDCLGCHLPARDLAPAQANDSDKWIYTFGYPFLNKENDSP